MSQYVVLGAKSYDFKNNDGQAVTGIKLTYLDSPESVADFETTRGYSPLVLSAPIELWEEVKFVPGIYDIDFRMKPDSKGKPTLQVTNLEFKSCIKFEQCDEDPDQAAAYRLYCNPRRPASKQRFTDKVPNDLG